MRKKIIMLALMLITLVGCTQRDDTVTISVASSLTAPISEIIKVYEKENNTTVNINSGSSGTLEKQIENGAEVDIFFSANEYYMNELVKKGIVSNDFITYPISNSLVLIKNNNLKEDIKSLKDVEDKNISISIGETSTVPIGQYTKEALDNLNLLKSIEDKIVYAKDANTVKTYVESGNVDLGIVYKSDAINLKNSTVVYEIPQNTHSEIKYALAPIKANEESNKIIELINSQDGKKILKKYGFNIEE